MARTDKRGRYNLSNIQVRERDNPKEYQRQYYLKITKPKLKKLSLSTKEEFSKEKLTEESNKNEN